jgi:3-hydroxy-3-methylglutaryl CoA synthase
MSERGIVGFAGYIPRRRLPRATIAAAMSWANPGLKSQARGEIAIRAWDEDALTMAVEVSRNCGLDALPAPDSLWLASTTLPFADRDSAVVVAEALGLDAGLDTLDLTSSQRAGTGALAAALKAGERCALVIASDCREAKPGSTQEMQIGHAAAAVMVGPGDRSVARWLGHKAIARDMVDHYRVRGERFDYTVEERWVRDEGFMKIIPETVRALFASSGVAAETVSHAIFPCPAAVGQSLCKSLGIAPKALIEDLAGVCGHTGTPHPLLLLARTLESAAAGDTILLVGFGQGADAFLFQTTERIREHPPRRTVQAQLARRREEPSYVRFLAQQGLVPVDWGNRAEFDNRTALTAFYRKHDSITGFKGGRCTVCGTVQFPPARVCVNPGCRKTDTQELLSLSGVRGRIKSFTEDWLAATVNPPLQYGNVELEGGGNVFMEFTDCEPGTLAIGRAVEMCFRIKDVDRRRGFTRYFWKPTLVEE